MPESSGAERAEDIVREGRGRPPATFDQTSINVALMGQDGRWHWVNQVFCEVVGYARDELMRLTFRDITYPEDLEADMARPRRLLDGEISTDSTQKRYVRKDGSIACTKLAVSIDRTPEGKL